MDIGIALEQSTDASLIRTVEDHGGNVHTGAVTSFPDALDVVLVDGWDAVRAVICHDITAPVLAIENPPGLGSIAVERLGTAIDAIQAGNSSVRSYSTLSVRYRGTVWRALAQSMLMTQTPASISEYAIYNGDTQVGRYRADGMAIATPTGSCEYARSAGGPVLSPTVEGIVVVPIAPYRTNPDHWVFDDTLSFEVLRQRGEVGLFLDGNEVTTIDPNERITIETGEPIFGIQVPQSRSVFHLNQDSP